MSELDPRTGRSNDSLIGRVVSDRYRIVRKLGEGGIGGVYFAEHLLVNRKVALKVLLPDMASPEAIDMFLEEARTVARIGHENVIDIFYGGRSPDGFVFLAMEYLEGVDLGEVLRREGTLRWDRGRKILLQIAGALGAVHQHGIVHRDIKPDNVFLIDRAGKSEFVKVLDFGIAKVTSAVGLRATDQGRVSGTPEYMAPEQAQAGHIDARADVYSLGCVAYHMITGEPPFTAPSIMQVLAKHLNEAPVPPSQKRPDLVISAEMDALVMRALEKDPARRWPDMAAFADAIERCREGRRSITMREGMPPPAVLRVDDSATHIRQRSRTRRGRILAVLAVEAVVVGALLGYRAFTHAPGHLQVTVEPADATVLVDDVPVGARSPVLFDAAPGRHALSVSRPGYVTLKKQIDVEARERVTIPVALQAAAPGADTAEAGGGP
jgi:serine/threonine protein kinase